MYNIQQVKSLIAESMKISLPVLGFVRQMEQDKTTPTKWLSHWDNENRVRISAHEDIVNKLKAEPTAAILAFKKEEVPADGDRKAYTRFVLITPQSVEATF